MLFRVLFVRKAAPKKEKAGPPRPAQTFRRSGLCPQLLPLRVERQLFQDPPLVRLAQHHHLDLVAGRCRPAKREAHPHGIAIGPRRVPPDPLAILEVRLAPRNLRPDGPKDALLRPTVLQ